MLTLTAVIMLVVTNSKTKFTLAHEPLSVDLILDAGHGGMDGGAVSASGVCEAPINLAICQKAQILFGFCGMNALMTRTDESSLDYDPAATARINKNADLKARLRLGQQHPDCAFLSIHLNQFRAEKYHGAQVFYSENHPGSLTLACVLQEQLRLALDPNNTRICKPSPERVFLMKNLLSPAVTVECGFLSNPEECARLQQEDYQMKIALALVSGYSKNEVGNNG